MLRDPQQDLTSEESWERANANYLTTLAQSDINPVYFELYPVMIALIERLVSAGVNHHYYAFTSHERLCIRRYEHRRLVCAAAIVVNPREGNRVDCYFHRAKERPDSPATLHVPACDLDRAEMVILSMLGDLDQYRHEIPPDEFNIPEEWYLK